MKKILVFSVLMTLGIQLIAQVDHDQNLNDRVPVVTETISQNMVPPAVIKAVNTQFNVNNPLTWFKFPYALKEYGWVYDVGSSDIPLDRYEVTMKTSSGNDLWAVYNAKGEIIQSREISTNIAIPQDVLVKLANSQYKDWTVVGDKEIIRYYHDNDFSKVEQHFRITVEKNNEKRSISFNYKGNNNKI